MNKQRQQQNHRITMDNSWRQGYLNHFTGQIVALDSGVVKHEISSARVEAF